MTRQPSALSVLSPWWLCWVSMLLSPGQLAAQEVEIAPGWTLEKFDWSGPLGHAVEMEIANPYGDVRCRATDGTEVVVVANIQRHEDDPRRADVEVGPEGEGRFAIRVSYRESESGEVTAEMAKRRVDVSVLVPQGTRLMAETEKGLIEVKGLSAPIVAETRSGDVAVKTSGPVWARTEHGTIDVTFGSTSWGGEVPSLETLTGDITVWLPPEASAAIEAETRGEISTDYSITIERRPPNEKKHARVSIGGAENRLSIKTEKGRVRLFRSN